MKKRIAIFASGSGSNAQKLMEHFKRSPDAEVSLVLTNNPDAYVLQRADSFEVPSHIFDRQEFYHTDNVIDLLKNLISLNHKKIVGNLTTCYEMP